MLNAYESEHSRAVKGVVGSLKSGLSHTASVVNTNMEHGLLRVQTTPLTSSVIVVFYF